MSAFLAYYLDILGVNQHLVVVIRPAVTDCSEVFNWDLDWKYLATLAMSAGGDEAYYSVDGFEFGVEFAYGLGGVWSGAVGAV